MQHQREDEDGSAPELSQYANVIQKSSFRIRYVPSTVNVAVRKRSFQKSKMGLRICNYFHHVVLVNIDSLCEMREKLPTGCPPDGKSTLTSATSPAVK
jgi:hypothetical protein